MSDVYDGMIGTVGIELETELIPEHFQIPGWNTTHDASIEMPVSFVRNRSFGIGVVKTPENIGITRLLRAERRILGREFISGIFMGDKELERSISSALSYIQGAGERTRNKRAGLHVHVGWAYDLRVLKRTIRMISWVESLLFHLGGMGYEFRGMDNNSAYCRPLTLFGPPVVSSNLGAVQMTSIDALLEAPSVCSFWNRFGGINMMSPPKRYTPQRYMAVNLASIFFHKTLEFRMFNTTLNKDYVLAIVKLCKELTLFTLANSKFPDEENSVYLVSDRRVNHNILTKLCELIEIDAHTEEMLREIIERSPVPTLDCVYVLSHLEDRSVRFDTNDLSNISSCYHQIDEYIRPGIVDIHTMDNAIAHAMNAIERDESERLGRIMRIPHTTSLFPLRNNPEDGDDLPPEEEAEFIEEDDDLSEDELNELETDLVNQQRERDREERERQAAAFSWESVTINTTDRTGSNATGVWEVAPLILPANNLNSGITGGADV